MKVHLPDDNESMVAEVRRRHPRVALRVYDRGPSEVRRSRGDVLVVYLDAPPRGYHRGMVGCADPESRTIFVFVGRVRRLARVGWDDLRLATAIGRTIAHEVEHARRWPSGAHDRRGWFTPWACRAALVGRAS